MTFLVIILIIIITIISIKTNKPQHKVVGYYEQHPELNKTVSYHSKNTSGLKTVLNCNFR